MPSWVILLMKLAHSGRYCAQWNGRRGFPKRVELAAADPVQADMSLTNDCNRHQPLSVPGTRRRGLRGWRRRLGLTSTVLTRGAGGGDCEPNLPPGVQQCAPVDDQGIEQRYGLSGGVAMRRDRDRGHAMSVSAWMLGRCASNAQRDSHRSSCRLVPVGDVQCRIDQKR